MPFDVSTADIEMRWRALTTEEEDIGLVRLLDAERKLRLRRPKLLAFYTALSAGVPKEDLLETIRAVLAGSVIRYLRNPDVNNRQDIGADGSIGIGFDTLTSGGIYFTDEELGAIDAAVAVAAEVPVSRFASRRLISTFPYRTSTPVATTPVPTFPTAAELAANVAFANAFGPVVGSDLWLIRQAKEPEDHLYGALTRDSNNIVVAASFRWDDGKTGIYTATATSLGVISYQVTYPGTPDKTIIQPTIVRDGTGLVTDLPEMTVT